MTYLPLSETATDDIDALLTARADRPTPPPAGEVMSVEMVPVDLLFVDPRYQRLISNQGIVRMRKMVRDFKWSRFGALIVAREEGRFAVLDGQHRALVAIAMGIKHVPATIITNDLAGQAADFVGINSTRTTVATINKFRARVTAGDPTAVEVSELLSELNISTDVPAGGAMGPKQTRAIVSLERVVKQIGKGLSFTALEMLLDAQPDQKNLLTSLAIEATALCVAKVTDAEGNLERLFTVIEETDFETLAGEAGQLVKLTGGKRVNRAHELMMKAYNHRLKKRIAA